MTPECVDTCEIDVPDTPRCNRDSAAAGVRSFHMDARIYHEHSISRSARNSFVRDGEEPPLGSHLVSPRTFYDHHGIYVGNGRVIHYAGLADGLRRGPVEEVSLANFARGRAIRIRQDVPRFAHREIVERARSRLGERRYRILTNNCKHFCDWARGREGSRRFDQTGIANVGV